MHARERVDDLSAFQYCDRSDWQTRFLQRISGEVIDPVNVLGVP